MTATRVAGNKEGNWKGSMGNGNGNGNEEGNGNGDNTGNGNGYGDEGGGRAMMATIAMGIGTE